MHAVDIIAKKRDGLVLSADEISFFIEGFARGSIPDYQASAWAMAVLLRGMSPDETAALTMAMVRSGETLDLSSLRGIVVDKHSTGGVGDKTTLIVAPMVAALGLPVAKMSGRGLGYSGGTLDKLESIPGLTTSLTVSEFLSAVRANGIAVVGQTADLVPADGRLYALRDVTATVPSLPLIASSVMSKKIAGGAQAIVLDVKVGRGAFMPDVASARELAEVMIALGRGVGRRVTALLTGMDQPLGCAVGNALEVAEAIDALKGDGPADLREHCLAIAAEMALLGGAARTLSEARALLVRALDGGEALERFSRWISGQGGDVRVVERRELLPSAPTVRPAVAPRAGYVAQIDAREVGMATVELGAGRLTKGDTIDPGVGVVLAHKVGDRLARGEALFVIHARNGDDADRAERRIQAAFAWSDVPVGQPPLVYETLRG
jgi:pyrimidine-nucleoside phosphorylase